MPWKKITACLLILIFFGLLVIPHTLDPTAPAESATRGDAAHFPAFLLLTLLFCSLFSKNRTVGFRMIAGSLAALTLAISSELMQSFIPGRTASLNDLFANLLGVIAAMTGFWIWNQSNPHLLSQKKLLHAIVTIAITATLSMPYIRQVEARLAGQRHFPTLSDFKDPRLALLWKTQLGTRSELILLPAQATPALEVTLPGKLPIEGIKYRPGPQDWSRFKNLHFTLINPGSPFTIGIRIDDDGDVSQLHSRFNADSFLKTGENYFSFPLRAIENGPKQRDLNLEAIRRISLFTLRESKSHKFQIVRIWLE